MGPGRGKARLPINEEDLALVYGGGEEAHEEELEAAAPFSFLKLFFTIIIAAPVATALSLAVGDVYDDFAKGVGLRKAPVPVIAQQPAEKPEDKTADSDYVRKLADALEGLGKTNRSLVSAVNSQTKALEKMAAKKPDVVKVETGAKVPDVKVDSPKVIVVKVPSRERFDLEYEKRRILELAHIDIDDPVTGPGPFNKIGSREIIKELIRSFNAILAASRDHEEVSDILKENVLLGKKYALQRLKKLK